jgi:hypothetical protein
MLTIRKTIASKLESGILRALLWTIRRFGFRLVLDGNHMIYEWVSGLDGSFDHWFHSPERDWAIWSAKRHLGFRQFLWQILTKSQLLIGQRRRYQNEAILGRSELYYCTEPIFTLRALSRRPDKRPNSNPRLVIDAACASCGQICEPWLDPMAIRQVALDHSAATGHVVVLNVTAEVLEV